MHLWLWGVHLRLGLSSLRRTRRLRRQLVGPVERWASMCCTGRRRQGRRAGSPTLHGSSTCRLRLCKPACNPAAARAGAHLSKRARPVGRRLLPGGPPELCPSPPHRRRPRDVEGPWRGQRQDQRKLRCWCCAGPVAEAETRAMLPYPYPSRRCRCLPPTRPRLRPRRYSTQHSCCILLPSICLLLPSLPPSLLSLS